MVVALPPVNIELPIHRIASQEAVSLEARLALVARRRGQVETAVFDRLAQMAEATPPSARGLTVDKRA